MEKAEGKYPGLIADAEERVKKLDERIGVLRQKLEVLEQKKAKVVDGLENIKAKAEARRLELREKMVKEFGESLVESEV